MQPKYSTMAHEEREKQGYIGDLSKKTRPELLDLLSRQEKLLANRKFISRLPDKGKKILGFKTQIEQILNQKRENVGALADEIARLRIARTTEEQDLDSDDEEDRIPSVWETLAANGIPTKKVSSKSALVEDEELPNQDRFYTGLAHVMDEKVPQPVRPPLKLNRTRTKTDGKKVDKPQPSMKRHQVEEESAVRYPIGPHAETKVLSIKESLQLQTSHVMQMKELQVKQAGERLAEKRIIAIGEYEPEGESKMNYRDPSERNGDLDDSTSDED